jgi:4a-hydroxytetrahydrobiopterin dehydratase
MDMLTLEAAQAQMAALPAWRHDAWRGAITREFTFTDFAQAFAFMTRLAEAAERHGHHPEWFNLYNRVDITFTTHDAGGLTQSDIDMAHEADRAHAQVTAATP